MPSHTFGHQNHYAMTAHRILLASVAAIPCFGVMAQLDMGPLPTAVWCAGTSIDIPFTASGAFDPGNTFIMEISDASGTFAPGMPIGSLTGTTSGTITCTGTPLTTGPGHLVRVRSTSPALTSTSGATALTVAAPDAGMDGSLILCGNGTSVDLDDVMPGGPGWIWTDPNNTGGLNGSQLSPSLLPPGTYPFIYTVEELGCSDSATLTVVVQAPADAGTNATITVCSTDPPFNMYQVLGGTPTAGGAWSAPSGVQVSGMFDPATDPSGVYVYVVHSMPPCANAMSTLAIMVNQAANAGTNGTATFCPTDAPFQLMQHLGGSPSPAGTWAFNTVPHAPVFIPGTDVPGVYTYTVPGTSPCTNATATVTLSQGTCATGPGPVYLMLAPLPGPPLQVQ